MLMGTPAYMSPEQVRGEPADHRSDIFAFGCVLYEMLSGTRAFRRDTPVASMNAVLSEAPPELTTIDTNIPLALERLVGRCLEKEAHNRFQSANDLAFALENISGFATGSTGIALREPRRRRGFRTALASGAFAAVVILAFLFGRVQRPPVTARPEAMALNWRGERLEGPAVAFTPRLSPDGKELALSVMVNGLNQLAVMLVDSGDWRILTTNRSRGLIGEVCWSSNGSEIYYSHVAGWPNGIYRISRLGGEERLVVEHADDPQTLLDGSILIGKREPDGNYRLHLFSPESEQSRPLNAFPRTGFISGRALLPDRLVTSGGLISAKLVKVDAVNDLAILKAEGKFSAPCPSLPVGAQGSAPWPPRWVSLTSACKGLRLSWPRVRLPVSPAHRMIPVISRSAPPSSRQFRWRAG